MDKIPKKLGDILIRQFTDNLQKDGIAANTRKSLVTIRYNLETYITQITRARELLTNKELWLPNAYLANLLNEAKAALVTIEKRLAEGDYTY
jgi:hypothetical protein